MFIDKNITSAKQRSVIMVTVTSEITELMTEAGAGRLVNNCGSCHKSLKLQEYVLKNPIMNCNIAKFPVLCKSLSIILQFCCTKYEVTSTA